MCLFHSSRAQIAAGCALGLRLPEVDWRAGRLWLEGSYAAWSNAASGSPCEAERRSP